MDVVYVTVKAVGQCTNTLGRVLHYPFEQLHPSVGEQLAEPRTVLEVDDMRYFFPLLPLLGALDGCCLRLFRWERRNSEGRGVLNVVRVRREGTMTCESTTLRMY